VDHPLTSYRVGRARGKYRDVILPFTVWRRLDAVLEPTKQAVLERKRFLDENEVAGLPEMRKICKPVTSA
jgi:type I restriction-modification system DNA methylase subunit